MKDYVMITGASTGIGKELAKVFAINQYNLILIARNKENLNLLKQTLEKEHKIKVEILAMDLTLKESPKKIYEYIKKKQFNVQILINNAGFATNGFYLHNDLETEIKEVQLNILALMELTYYIGNEMLKDSKNKPRFYYKILNVASIAGYQPGPYMSTYYATKAYVLHFSEGLYEEFKTHNILVSTLCPGATQTEFFKRANIENTKLANPFTMMSAETVAIYAYKKLMENKPIIIPGFLNKFGTLAIRFFPRSMIRKITKYLNSH